MKDFSVIGKSVLKKDAMDKVLGKAVFAADMEIPNMIYGVVVRSTVPSAYIKSIDLEKAKALEGVVAVLTSKDIPGSNRIGIIFKDEPVLVDDKVRRYGDAIAVIGAETMEIAEEAAKLVAIEYEEIEAILTVERALEEDSPKIIGTTNIMQKKVLSHGMEIDEAFKKCDVIVENTYETAMLSHMYIEPDGGLAKYEDGIITIYSSTQNPHFDRGEVAKMLNMPNSKVRSVQLTTGGGFGGKLDISVQCHMALLAYHTKRPVKMVRGRKESNMVSSKRHPMKMTAKTGATKDGKLVAMYCYIEGDTGAYASYGPAVITRAMVHATGPYEIPNVKVDATFVYTNNPMSGAFRGFGVPQIAVCHEGQMDALAKALNMDGYEIRRINAHKIGSEIATGQILTESMGLIETLDKAEAKANEVMDKNIKGRSVASMWYGIGNTGLPNPSAAFVEVLHDASVNLMVGCADIGQGSTTVMAQIVAEELGVSYDNVNVISADTAVTPEGGATSASRQTFISGNASRNAAKMAKETLKGVASAVLKVEADDLIFKDNEIFSAKDNSIKMSYIDLMAEMKKFGKLAVGAGSYNPNATLLSPVDMSGIPYEAYAYATTVAEVEVDTETGRVYLTKVVSAHDVGQAINKQMVEGQIEGGVVMGQGFALFEKVEVTNGRITNPMFSKYLLATSMDIPEIYPIVVESGGEAGPFGAKGVGEPALIPIIPAIVGAIENAIGVRFNKLPITPTDVLRELNK